MVHYGRVKQQNSKQCTFRLFNSERQLLHIIVEKLAEDGFNNGAQSASAVVRLAIRRLADEVVSSWPKGKRSNVKAETINTRGGCN